MTKIIRASPSLAVSQMIPYSKIPYQATACCRPNSAGIAILSSGVSTSAIPTPSSPKITACPNTPSVPTLFESAVAWFTSETRICSALPISEL